MIGTCPVPLFTPVETKNTWSMLPALYLSPLFGNKEIALFDPVMENDIELQRCLRKESEPTFAITALKIASYILSLGILPLLAIVLNLAIRCNTQYWYPVDANFMAVRLVDRAAQDIANSTQTTESLFNNATDSVTQMYAIEEAVARRKNQASKPPFFSRQDQFDEPRHKEFLGLVNHYYNSPKTNEELQKMSEDLMYKIHILEVAEHIRR